MTYRQRLHWRVRAVLWPICGCALAIGVVFVQNDFVLPVEPGNSVVAPIVIAGVLFALVSQYLLFRCPSCRQNLGIQSFSDWGLPRFRYCPYCAFDLEEEIDTADEAIHRP